MTQPSVIVMQTPSPQIIHTQAPSTLPPMKVTASPAHMTCPYCRTNIVTSVTHKTGSCTWLSAVICLFVGCGVGAFIPFCLDSAKDVYHGCPGCKAQVGVIVGCKISTFSMQ